MNWKQLGIILLDKHYINQNTLNDSLREQKDSGDYLGKILMNKKSIRKMKLKLVLNEQSNTAMKNVEKYRYLPFEDLTYTIIDVLTTGINYDSGARICELAMIKFKGEEILSSFSKVIRMEDDLPVLLKNVFECAPQIHSAKYGLDHFKPVIEQYLGGEVVVAFSLPFVFDFIYKHFSGKLMIKDPFFLDMLTIWRRLRPGPGHGYLSFTKFTTGFGLEVLPPYSSIKNCMIIKNIFRAMLEELDGIGVDNLKKLEDFQDRKFYFGVTDKYNVPPEIKQSITKSQVIEIEYYSPWTQERTFRKIDPYELLFRENNAYLLGYCHLRKEFRTFRLDRIGKLKPTGKNFKKRKKPPFWGG